MSKPKLLNKARKLLGGSMAKQSQQPQRDKEEIELWIKQQRDKRHNQ